MVIRLIDIIKGLLFIIFAIALVYGHMQLRTKWTDMAYRHHFNKEDFGKIGNWFAKMYADTYGFPPSMVFMRIGQNLEDLLEDLDD